MMKNIKAILVSLICIFASASYAQPNNVIKMIVAFPPGGPVDSMARSLLEPLGKELNAQIVIENKPGGNGAIAAEYVAANPADGKALWFTSAGAVAINPGLYEKLSYNPVKDLAPVSLVANNVEVLVVNPGSPASNAVDFVTLAKGKDLTMGSSGTGSVPHLALEQLNDSAGIKILHVPYKGAAPAITDVMAGHVDGFFGDIPGLISYIKSGKLKPIGLAADKRNSAIPDVKTFNEKPQTSDGRISGGFFVANSRIFDYLNEKDNLVFEKEPIENLVKTGNLMVFEHNDFWQPMDTSREYHYLNNLYNSNNAPWVIW